MGLLICVDGIDGAGKTTVAKKLCANGDFHYFQSPSGPFKWLRKWADRWLPPLKRYKFYMWGNVFSSIQIWWLLKRGKSVVCDRFWASTVAYHVAMDKRILGVHHYRLLVKPSLYFILEVRSDIRNKRILKRPESKKAEKNSVFLDRVAVVFRELDGSFQYLDTSGKTPKEVVREIISITRK